MRLAILSDVHGNLVALEAVLADLRTRGADAYVNLGDCVSSPLWPRETLALLDTLGWPTVRGNHDRWLVDDPPNGVSRTVAFAREAVGEAARARLAALPATLAPASDVLAVHGRPNDDMSYLLEDAVDGRLAFATPAALDARLGGTTATLVLCGHSHLQHTALAPGGRLAVNPGSVGCPRQADNAEPWIAEAASPHARYAIATRRGTRWSVELFALAYDWDAVVRQAKANGRADWGAAFMGDVAR
jgi:predicted phosphodiesterase